MSAPSGMTGRLLTADDVAAYLGLKRGTVYEMVRSQRLPHVRVSRRAIRFTPEQIEQWVERQRVEVH